MELIRAQKIAEDIISRLSPYCERIEVAGSIRRKKPEVGDIELVCIPKIITIRDGLFDTKKIRHPGFAAEMKEIVILKGDPSEGKYIQFNLPQGIKLDLFTATSENWGTILLIRTGDWKYSKYFMGTLLPQHGYRQKDGYVWKGNKIIPVPEENDVFALVGMAWILPENRIAKGHVMPGVVP